MFSQYKDLTYLETIENLRTAGLSIREAKASFAIDRLKRRLDDVYQLTTLKSAFLTKDLYNRASEEEDNIYVVEVAPLWLSKSLRKIGSWGVPQWVSKIAPTWA